MIGKLTTFAQNKFENCDPSSTEAGCLSVLPQVSANEGQVQSILAVVFGVFAAIAVIVIVIAAINFATADGNPDNISRAKKTIIYALIGLVIALSAEAIVLTLLGRF